jgi:hypothetical protein
MIPEKYAITDIRDSIKQYLEGRLDGSQLADYARAGQAAYAEELGIASDLDEFCNDTLYEIATNHEICEGSPVQFELFVRQLLDKVMLRIESGD